MASNDPYKADAQALAAILGVSRGRVPELVAEGMPCERRGTKSKPWRFDLRRAVPWWGGYRERLAAEGDGERLDARQERALRDRTERELKQLELDRLRGELAPIADCEATIVRVLSGVRNQLLALPATLAEELAAADGAAEAAAILEKAIHEAMTAIADGKVVSDEATG